MDRIAVVGASLAGLEAAKALRREGFSGDLVIIGAEPAAPYDRPPLSKRLLSGAVTADTAALDLGEAADAEWRLGAPATRLDAARRTLWAGNAAAEPFDGIILAVGASPVRPRLGHSGERELAGIHVVRTLDDSLALAAELRAGPRRVVIAGAGFVGSEVASTCRALGLPVTVVEGLSVPMERALGPEVGQAMARLQLDHGVDLRLGTTVTGVRGGHRVEQVVLADGSVVAADVLVLAVGVRPNTAWLTGSGLTIDDGVVCDETGLAAPGITAAGDVARWPNRRYGELRRVEHWDNAIRQGRHAARVLLHGPQVYEPVPWFWSDQFGAKLQLLGSPRPYDEFLLASGTFEAGKFVGFYRRGDRLVAAVSLNAARAMLTCRPLLEQNSTWAEALTAFGIAERPGAFDPPAAMSHPALRSPLS
jgi:3-phenylpropionate/trans-cinnamate dioxygenase ferredoxin reductase component